MIKQNWNDTEVLVMDKNDIIWLLQFLKPEFEKRKKAFEKIKAQYDSLGSDGQPVIGSRLREVQSKYDDLREKFESLAVRYRYLTRFSIKFAWDDNVLY